MSKRAKPERFEARPSLPKIALFTVAAGGMTAASFWMTHRPDPFGVVIGWIGTAFFGMCTVGIVRQLFRKGPAITVGPEGIMSRRWSRETIPWRAFTHARVDNRMVSLWLADPDAYRSMKLLGLLSGLNKAGGYGDILLMPQMLDCSVEDIAEAVHRHRPSLFRR